MRAPLPHMVLDLQYPMEDHWVASALANLLVNMRLAAMNK